MRPRRPIEQVIQIALVVSVIYVETVDLAILREDGEYGEYEGGPVQNDLPVH